MSKTRNTGNLVSENNIFVDVTNDRVGIGSTQPTAKLNVSGIVSATSYYGDGSNLSGISASMMVVPTRSGTAVTFTIPSTDNAIAVVGRSSTINVPV